MSTANRGLACPFRSVMAFAALIAAAGCTKTGPATMPLPTAEVINPYRVAAHPLEIEQVVSTDKAALAVVRNHGDKTVTFSLAGKSHAVRPGGHVEVRLDWPPGPRPFEATAITAQCADLPAVSRPLVAFNPAAGATWVRLQNTNLTLEVAPDGTGARLIRKGVIAAVIAPLVWRDGHVPRLAVEKKNGMIRLTGPGITRLELRLEGDEISYRLEATDEMEGPVVRVQGNLEQGLLAGVEHLGKGERSSSKLDIRGPEHRRNEPDPMKLTMPLAVFVSDRASGALLWTDTGLHPTFATPNFYDGAADHRMSLKGRRIDAVIRISPGFAEGGRLEDAIVWAVKRRGGLPPLPPAPRTPEAQRQLHLDAFTKSGTVAGRYGGRAGWYHAGGMPSQPKYFADHASTIWQLTDRAPDIPTVVPGGAHVPNDAIWFVTGRAADWLRHVNEAAEAAMKSQQPDGSYRYDGRFREGHFENTASGLCAVPAVTLIEHARLTGSRSSLDAAVKTLEYMKRFRTPRGVQVWECPLHSPDLLASAYLVWAYTRGYELTGKREYLDLAVRWAASGVPFVYQWTHRPIMLYTTTPVLCATHWVAPVWVGIPVQWCGTVYAYAILMLAPHDATLDWKKLAEGILIAGEQMQYPNGQSLGWGCLPDSFELKSQQRRPPDINPCVLVSLRRLIEGKLDSLAVAAEGHHRVVAPFPVTIRRHHAVIAARKGVEYQVVIDGRRVVTVKSEGRDVIPLDPG